MSWNISKIIIGSIVLIAPVGIYLIVDHNEKVSRSLNATEVINSASKLSLGTDAITLKSINPKNAGNNILLVEQPATVEPYYRATLYSDITGRIRFFEKALGQKVKKNEVIAIVDPSKGSNGTSFNITSPFDGVIAARTADPGDFVANAGVIPGAASLAVVERNDIVTICANLPDVLLTQVNKNTPVELIFDGLPGGKIKSTISRIAPSINIADRTIKVEIDIYNRNKIEFDALIAQEKKTSFQDFKGREQPIFPDGLASTDQANLMPGNYGRIRVSAKPSETAKLIPSSAIYRSGGLSYVFTIVNGKAAMKKVKIIVDDGNLVQAVYLVKENGVEITKPLISSDEIAISNQSEVDDGDNVVATLVTW